MTDENIIKSKTLFVTKNCSALIPNQTPCLQIFHTALKTKHHDCEEQRR